MDVVNAYWFGGIDKIPPGTHYIGRGTPYGNPFHTTDTQTREYVVAKYWIYLHTTLRTDPSFMRQVMQLDGHDLACTCKSKTTFRCCHGDPLLYMITENKKRGWTEGQTSLAPLGVKELYLDLQKKIKGTRTEIFSIEIGIPELFLDIETHLHHLRTEKQTAQALQFFVTTTLYLQSLYNEGREMSLDHFEFVCGALMFYMGQAYALPYIDKKNVRKKKSSDHALLKPKKE